MLRHRFSSLGVKQVPSDCDAEEAAVEALRVLESFLGWCFVSVLSSGVCSLVSVEVLGMTFPTWSEELLTVFARASVMVVARVLRLYVIVTSVTAGYLQGHPTVLPVAGASPTEAMYYM